MADVVVLGCSYVNAKIHEGHLCTYCMKHFGSGQATQKHMVDKGHCRILYQEGQDMDEYEEFYDFTRSYVPPLGCETSEACCVTTAAVALRVCLWLLPCVGGWVSCPQIPGGAAGQAPANDAPLPRSCRCCCRCCRRGR